MNDITLSWIDARRENPRDGDLVLAAITGHYPTASDEVPSSEQDFWVVLPMHFRHVHPVEATSRIIFDCYIDADRAIRRPYGSGWTEEVTHWAGLPALPGTVVSELIGASVAPMLTATFGPTQRNGETPVSRTGPLSSAGEVGRHEGATRRRRGRVLRQAHDGIPRYVRRLPLSPMAKQRLGHQARSQGRPVTCCASTPRQ